MAAQVRRKTARRLTTALWSAILSYWVSLALRTSRKGAWLRRTLLIFGGGFLWALLGWFLHPYVPEADRLLSLLVYPFDALFAADVFRHILIGALVFWMAFRFASIFLDDIFELKDVRIAERFVRQAAFASQYDAIEIQDGDVAIKDRKSPIYLIGGPGKLRVYLENAVLVERVDGRPRVIQPTAKKRAASIKQGHPTNPSNTLPRGKKFPWSILRPKAGRADAGEDVDFIEGFERIRSVVDLRDYVDQLEVFGRTRDGIRISAKDMRLIFSVLRDGQPSDLDRPYPFVPQAIETLVYGQRISDVDYRTETRLNWSVAMISQIRTELGRFISQHTLSEFLAAISEKEIERMSQDNARLQELANQRAGVSGPTEPDSTNAPDFEPRPKISDLFYDLANFTAKARDQGVQLRWIGLGTWELPDKIIPERHLDAWRLSYENVARGNRTALESVFESNRVSELLNLVHAVPLETFQALQAKDQARTPVQMAALVNAYRAKMHAALEIYDHKQQSDALEARRLREVLNHLLHVAAHFLGD